MEEIKLENVNVYFTKTDKKPAVPSIETTKIRVYKGYFNGTTPVALKRYELTDEIIKEQAEKDFLCLSSPKMRHENIIRYFGSAKDNQFWYEKRKIVLFFIINVIKGYA